MDVTTSKNEEVGKLREEVIKLTTEFQKDEELRASMKTKLSELETDKTKLMAENEQLENNLSKLRGKYTACKNDRLEFEDMVDRLSREMEETVEGLREEHRGVILSKDNQIRGLYCKVRALSAGSFTETIPPTFDGAMHSG